MLFLYWCVLHVYIKKSEQELSVHVSAVVALVVLQPEVTQILLSQTL